MANELIAYWDPAHTLTGHCEAAVTGKRFVVISGPRVNGLPQISPAGAGARVFGIAGQDAGIGAAVTIHRGPGVFPVRAGAAITAGTVLASDTTGQAVPASTALGVAIAVDDADSGEDVPVVLIIGGDGGDGITPGDPVADLVDNTTGTDDGTLEAIPDPDDSPADADALRDDLVTNVLPAVRNDFADLAATVNALLAELRSAGVIDT